MPATPPAEGEMDDFAKQCGIVTRKREQLPAVLAFDAVGKLAGMAIGNTLEDGLD
jgi:hypothetical protein